MQKTFFFYDLETSGLNPRADRIMQFAGQRTTMELEPIGEPVNILVKMTDDALPSPEAIMVTKITPQKTLEDGYSEAEFCKIVTEEIFTPNTIVVGYNNVRFDDEFMRAILWRSFYDPYEWEWKDGKSRWDILDVVRMVRALRPEGINWPVTASGAATNRLELITKLNGLKHEHAHDALSDVYATIAVSKLIRDKNPQMFNFLLEMRDKKLIKKYVNLETKTPVVYSSGRYSSEYNKTTVVVPFAPARNGNVLVWDLRYNLDDVLVERESVNDEKRQKGFFPIVKEFCFNKCPVVAPISVLDKAEGWGKIGLTPEVIEKNMATLMRHPEFAEQQRTADELKADIFEKAVEPEQALYEGFLGDSDRVKVAAVRNADERGLADFHPEFADTRLGELLLHYKGRNFPMCLSEDEMEKWEEYRRARINAQLGKFMEGIAGIYERDDFIAEELKLYLQSIM